MRRRAFSGGAVAAWPLAARAQQAVERVRRIGVLVAIAPDDPEAQARVAAFIHELQQLGWTDGRNVRVDIRWGAGDAERIRRYAARAPSPPTCRSCSRPNSSSSSTCKRPRRSESKSRRRCSRAPTR